MRPAFWIALGCAMLAAPARAADPATLNCIDARIDPTLRAEMQSALHGNGATSEPWLTLRKRLAAPALECRTEHRWSQSATLAALTWTVAGLRLGEARTYIREEGQDLAAIEAVWRSLPERLRIRGQLDPETQAASEAALRKAGLYREPNGSFAVGMLFGLLQLQDNSRDVFTNS